MTNLLRENQAGPMPAGGGGTCVLVVSPDPVRRAELARPLARPELRVVSARSPLEGLWSAPDARTVVLDRGAEVDLVDL